jgi:hypothetical protein
MTPEYAGRLCDDLDKCLRGSETNLEGLADMIRVVLREEAWRERRIRTGAVVQHPRFVDFLTTAPLEGLGEDPKRVKQLLRDDLEALAAFEAAIVEKPGRPTMSQKGEINSNNVTNKVERGNSRAYTLRRLAKNHPALFTQVTAGELTANEAAMQAGFRKAVTPLQQLSRAWTRASREERDAFLAWIEASA